jgi:hypothetical protein
MNPIEFPQQTGKLAKGQPQYRVLPIAIKELQERESCNACNGQGKIKQHPHDLFPGTCPICKGKGHLPVWSSHTCKYQLSELELAQIIETGCIYIGQLGYGFNPISPSVESPFGSFPIQYKRKGPGLYDFWLTLIIDEQEQVQQVTDQQPTAFIESVLNTFPELTAEQLYFVERPELAVDEQGNITEI